MSRCVRVPAGSAGSLNQAPHEGIIEAVYWIYEGSDKEVKNRLTASCRNVWLAALLFLQVVGCSREPHQPIVSPPPVGPAVVATTTILATIGEEEKPVELPDQGGHPPVAPAEGRPPLFTVVFSERGGGVAYTAAKDGKTYVVHNGKAGKPYAEVLHVTLSADGLRIAYGARVGEKWCMVINDSEGKLFDEVREPVFSPDGLHIAYEAKRGEKRHIVVDTTMNAGAKSYQGRPVFSDDSARLAYVEITAVDAEPRLVVSDFAFKKQTIIEGVAFMASSEDRRKIATIVSRGGKPRVVVLNFDAPDNRQEENPYDMISYLAVGMDGRSVAYTAQREGKNYIVMNGKEEMLPDASPVAPPVVSPNQDGAGVILASTGVFLHLAFHKGRAEKKKYEEADFLSYNKDGSLHAFAARRGNAWFVVINGREGPAFDRVVKPIFSPDGKKLTYRARKDGKRFVVVADADGRTIKQHSSYEQVFQPVFTADGKSVAYGVKDGNKLIWKVEKLGE